MRKVMIAAALGATLAAPAAADAFCGFYISGADAKLFNNATQVVMMRKGTRTVLSMQNNYQGPPKDFAMVVPVPVVLQKENVKTLPREIFARVDQLSAPRLVEYWEQDPCQVDRYLEDRAVARSSMPMKAAPSGGARKDLGVTVEAKFTVGEYQIVILSAKDSTGLDTWLRQEKYRIPEGAEPYLKPYVEGGSKFFVAKVDARKVKFENGQAMLSPLRFHYDSEQFNLPIRLGMMNSAGTQDLIVNILADSRHEVANYKNVTIPTNLDVKEEARERFGEFYAALFDRTLEKNPGAVVTEYSWDARSCDPCPAPPLTPGDLATLGADVLDTPMTSKKAEAAPARPGGKPGGKRDAVDDLLAEKSVAPVAAAPPDADARLRLDPAARPLLEGRRQRGPGLQERQGDRRRPRVARQRGQARGGRGRLRGQQLPGSLRDPPRVDRCHHLRQPGARPLGRTARRHQADRAGTGGGQGPGLRPARQDQARDDRQAGRPGDRHQGG